jgi:chromosome segregation ATPase
MALEQQVRVNSYLRRNVVSRDETIEQRTVQCVELKTKNKQLCKDVRQLKTENTQKDGTISQLQTDNTQLQTENTQKDGTISQLQTDNTQLQTDNTQLQTENTQLQTENTEVQEQNKTHFSSLTFSSRAILSPVSLIWYERSSTFIF